MIKIYTVGHIGRDTHTRIQKSSGESITTFSLAANHRTGNTEWISCSIKGKRAEELAPHLRKGVGVAIEGEPYSEAWIDKETKEVRSRLSVWVNDLAFVGANPKKDKQKSTTEAETADEVSGTEETFDPTGDCAVLKPCANAASTIVPS